MKLSNRTYDVLKRIALIATPQYEYFERIKRNDDSFGLVGTETIERRTDGRTQGRTIHSGIEQHEKGQ